MEKTITISGRLMADYSVDKVYIRYLSKDRRNHVKTWKEIYQDVRRQWAEAEDYRERNGNSERLIADHSMGSVSISDLSKDRRDHVKIWKELYQDVRRQWAEAENYRHRTGTFPSQRKTSSLSMTVSKPAARNSFLGSFRDCVAAAWENVDTQYYIPKSRFSDPEYNQTAYSASQVKGVFSKAGTFLKSLESLISTAWKESDHYYHLPKSSFQDPVLIQEKRKSSSRSQVKESFFAGLGVTGESKDGWDISGPESQTGNPGGLRPNEKFIVPEDVPGGSRKPEVGPE